MSRNSTKSRCCFVPMCKSSDKNTPGKIFLSVPSNPSIRKSWWKAVRREFPMSRANVKCCQDHFNVSILMYIYIMIS